ESRDALRDHRTAAASRQQYVTLDPSLLRSGCSEGRADAADHRAAAEQRQRPQLIEDLGPDVEPAQRFGEDDRLGALRAIGNLEGEGPTVRQRGGVYGLCAALREQTAYRAHREGVELLRSRDVFGMRTHGVGDLMCVGSEGRRNARAECRCQADEGKAEQRGAASVDRVVRDLFAREPFDRVTDDALDRVLRVEVSRDIPSVAYADREHRGVLTRTV